MRKARSMRTAAAMTLSAACAVAVTSGRAAYAGDELDSTASALSTTTELVSVKKDGTAPRNGESFTSAVSGDGRYVVFTSDAERLVSGAGPTGGVPHVYVRDRQTGTTSAVDVRPDGRFGNGETTDYPGYGPDISADGRYVVFDSNARNLTPGGSPHRYDIFLRDMVTGTTTLVCHAPDGAAADDHCYSPAISADGSTVVFQSHANNLVPQDNQRSDQIYRYDVATDSISLVSRATSGIGGNDNSIEPDVSGDGSLVVFSSRAHDMVRGDASFYYDTILYDVAADTTTLVSRRSGGQQPNGESFGEAISADGTAIVFHSTASNLVRKDRNGFRDIFRYDVGTGAIDAVSTTPKGKLANGDSLSAGVSADARYVAFDSYGSNIVRGDRNGHSDVFRLDTATGVTTMMSVTPEGQSANGDSSSTALSDDGSVVSYRSDATDLVGLTENHRFRLYATDSS